MKKMIRENIEANLYHAWPGISKSGLDKIARSPFHYKTSIERPMPQTADMILGSAAHSLILEPESFSERYVIAPEDLDRRTKVGKAIAEELEQSGKEILTAAQANDVFGMAQSVREHPIAGDMLSGGKAEVSVNCLFGEIEVRGRPDYWKGSSLVDLKTTRDASRFEFLKSIRNYRYHVQNAFYVDLMESNGVMILDFSFVVVEKTYPYAVAVYELDNESVEKGRQAYLQDLSVYASCLKTGEWPGYEEDIVTLSL